MRLLFAISLVLSHYLVLGQDGKMIAQIPFVQGNIDATCYRIEYLSDGLKVMGYLGIPKMKGKHPCIIYNRGGNREFGKISNESFSSLCSQLCSKGYIVIASQYRGNDGGEGKEEFGGKDVNDILNLIPVLQSIPEADTSRIGMFGWSRGGMMTYIALTETTKIRAAVVGSGLTDLKQLLKSRPAFDTMWAEMIPGYLENKEQILKQRSAVSFAKDMCKSTPLLILQGTADWRVPSDQVFDLATILYKVKHPFRLIAYEGGQHSLSEYKDEAFQEIIKWFDTYLRDRKPWPGLDPHGD